MVCRLRKEGKSMRKKSTKDDREGGDGGSKERREGMKDGGNL